LHCSTDCHSVRSKLISVSEALLSVLCASPSECTSLWGIQFVKVRCVFSEKKTYWISVDTHQFHNIHDITVHEKYYRKQSCNVTLQFSLPLCKRLSLTHCLV
jgi:hypothetical protein